MRPSLPQDPLAQYGIHRMVLQHVSTPGRERHWVLKGFHSRRLAALFDTYPDARIIWIHRDPVQVIASQITAFGQINECLAGSLDWEAYAPAQLESSRQNFHAYLDEPLVDDPRIHHVRYPDFVADAGRDDPRRSTSGAASRSPRRPRRRCATYLAANRSDRHGRFVYSTDVLPVDVGALHREFAPYRERFGIDIETRT